MKVVDELHGPKAQHLFNTFVRSRSDLWWLRFTWNFDELVSTSYQASLFASYQPAYGFTGA
jgi:hypothetical protein